MTYYVYGLTDPLQGQEGHDLISSIFYVGKGRGDRLSHHVAEVAAAMARELDAGELTNQGKVQRILDLLERDEAPRSVKIAAGIESESDAYVAEAFAIELVNAVLAARGLPELTNAVKGHGRSIMDLEEHKTFITAEDLRLEPLDHHSGRGLATCESWGQIDPGDVFSAIFVKLRREDFDGRHHEPLDKPPAGFHRAARSRIVIMDAGTPRGVRPEWNPNVPWTPEQAHERAYRYWGLARRRVEGWILDPQSAPCFLAALVPDRGRSVVRYVWRVDPNGTWERYEEMKGGRWGVPVVDPLRPEAHHPLIGRTPLKESGKGLLHGFAAGVRAGVFRVV